MGKVSFFTLLFVLLFLTYLLVASLIAFFTVEIVGIPIGKRMFAKIVLSIVAFVPLYLLVAYAISKFVSRDLRRLEENVRRLPFSVRVRESFIKEIDRLGRVLEYQSERIGSLIEAQRFTLYRLAHDLRTPLTNVKNVLQAIKEGVISDKEAGSYIDKVLEETDKLISLTEESLESLRKVSRESERKRIELCSFLRELSKIWDLSLSKKGVELRVNCPGRLYLNVSPLDLEEVVNNLIRNVLDHTNSRLIELKAESLEAGGVEVRVINEGEELDLSALKKAYRRGSLGLYIVRELVWKNDGELSINTNGGRTEVVLRFRDG